MEPTNRLKTGLGILRAIAQSDAVRDVRDRLREGAIMIAESERVPRVLSATAGVVAALLDEPAVVYGRDEAPAQGVDSWSHGSGASETRSAEVDAGDELDPVVDDGDEPESGQAAALRDLDGAHDLEEQLLGAEGAEFDDADEDGEERLLRFETENDAVDVGEADEAQPPGAPARRAEVGGAKKQRAAKPKAPGKAVKAKASREGNAPARAEGAAQSRAKKAPRPKASPPRRNAATAPDTQGMKPSASKIPARRGTRKK